MAGMRKTLRIAEFRALLISYVINRAGDVFGALALAVVVLGTTKSAIAVAALFLATQFVPGLVGPFLVARIGALAFGSGSASVLPRRSVPVPGVGRGRATRGSGADPRPGTRRRDARVRRALGYPRHDRRRR